MDKAMETSKAAQELSARVRCLEATVESDKSIMESQHRELQAHEADIEALRNESVILRRVIHEKDDKILTERYLYMELEKELWRIQREAMGVPATAPLRDQQRSAQSVIRQPSALQSRGWTPSALATTLRAHSCCQGSKSHGLMEGTASSSSSSNSDPFFWASASTTGCTQQATNPDTTTQPQRGVINGDTPLLSQAPPSHPLHQTDRA